MVHYIPANQFVIPRHAIPLLSSSCSVQCNYEKIFQLFRLYGYQI